MASSSINPLTPVSKTGSVLKRRKKPGKPADDAPLKKQKTDKETDGTALEDVPPDSDKNPHIDTYA
jgi:hypothetical protein